MIRLAGLSAFVGLTAQWLIYVFRDIVTTLVRVSNSESKPGRGIIAKVFGWPPPKLESFRETAWLDGLRGVAAFLVMAYHFHLAWWGPSLEAPFGGLPDDEKVNHQFWRLPFIRVWMCSGHAQVCVFFVLSGFVLSWSSVGAIRNGQLEKFAQSLSSAAFRRWFRLFIPCVIIGSWRIIAFRWGISDMPVDMKDTFLEQVWDYLKASQSFANPFHIDRGNLEALHVYSFVMWTIPYEWKGSLFIFLLILAVGRICDYKRRTIALLGVTFYTIYSSRWTYWLFAYGMILGDYVRQYGGFEELSRQTSRLSRIGWVSMFIAGLYLAGYPEHNPKWERPGYKFLLIFIPKSFEWAEGGARFWWCWCGIFLITSSCHLSSLRRFFELPFVRYLGKISFMLYLSHISVYEFIGLPVRNVLNLMFGRAVWHDEFKRDTYEFSNLGGLCVYLISWIVLGSSAICIGRWAEIFIDTPCIRFAKWIDDKFVNGFVPEPEEEEAHELLPS